MEKKLTPQQILEDPLMNKGTAFTQEERDALGLHGFLPFHVSTIEEQVKRRYENFRSKPTELAKYLFLSGLQNRNEVLFYRLVQEHLSEMLPLIYTPTVGDVSLDFSLLYRQHRGLYLSYPLQKKIDEIFSQLSQDSIDVIVITDGERILGLGDVGIGGMAIPQGKLSLYTLFGGIHPSRTLPILLDVGTNNHSLLSDPLYLGWRHPRVTGKEYDQFIALVVNAVKKRFPKVLLQWEDFAKPHARPLLEKYQNEICSFNDDIQGTAAVALAAILSAVKCNGTTLKEQRILIFGGGSAGLGIGRLIAHAIQEEGCSEQEAYSCFYVIDIDGLIHTALPRIDPEQRPFARSFEEVSSWGSPKISLLDVVREAKPTALIGVSAQPGVFTEEVVRLMSAHVERPIIFPLSNPTSKAEGKPQDLLQWSQGKAIVATGSPFSPVKWGEHEIRIAQCNNVYIFPGMGLGVIACATPKVTEKMFIRAAKTLSEHAPILRDPTSSLFPSLEELRNISSKIAVTVGLVAQEEGLVPTVSIEEIKRRVAKQMWYPNYTNSV